MANRAPYKQRERKYVVDYVRTKYPDSYVLYNFRVGGIPTKLEGVDITGLSSNIYKVFNRYVDAIVITADKIILIEAKILADIGAVSQLEYYASLVYQTPELAQYSKLPLELRIVTASADPSFVAYATSKGINVQVFQTQDAVDYLAQLLK